LIFLHSCGKELPINAAELHKKFIYATIREPLGSPDLHNVSEAANRMVEQLSRLSFESIINNKLTFTQNEIEEACPVTVNTPTGYTFFEEVQYYGLTKFYCFAHLSVQEFLAAYYIAYYLSSVDKLKVVHEFVWRNQCLNVFAFYLALTNGQRPSFRNSCLMDITMRLFLKSFLNCFRLFQCFYETGNCDLCHCIEEAKIFNHHQGKSIELSANSLSLSELECITFFLTHSVYKEWAEGINLYRCFIQDHARELAYYIMPWTCRCWYYHYKAVVRWLRRSHIFLIATNKWHCHKL